MTTPLHTFETPVPDLNDRTVLITGGTGSFGKAFSKAILERYKPKKTIIFSRDELKQSDMAQELPTDQYPSIRFFIGDVRDRDRLEMAMMGVDYVIPAAALKQVPTAEYNPMECINTNVIGAENVVQAAIRSDVKKVIALSTDKATNPINLYGASKLASDKICIAANNLSKSDGTKFSVVRYGNVIGSRGSVVPFFQAHVNRGASELPITDPRMTRFWITLNQGINFVLAALERMHGGEIFIPKIPSMQVTDLAECIGPGLKHKIVGIRPGEKLHETMITEDDARTTFDLGACYVIEPAFKNWTNSRLAGEDGSLVAEGFRYSSDTNTEWLGIEALRDMFENGET